MFLIILFLKISTILKKLDPISLTFKFGVVPFNDSRFSNKAVASAETTIGFKRKTARTKMLFCAYFNKSRVYLV